MRSPNKFLTGDPLRSDVCNVWVVTNQLNSESIFAAHALDTGYVPVQGEKTFTSLTNLASAIKAGVFGPFPRVIPTYRGDARYEKLYGVRDLNFAEKAKLKALGIRLHKFE